eukprot:g5816.t1
MSDLVNHTTQGKAFWYPESAQGAWMGQMGMGTHITPTKSMLVTNTSPIKPRPPPRCFQKVPRKQRPLRSILPVRLDPRTDFGKKKDSGVSFGSNYPSKSRVQVHFEVPGPGAYRLPEATGGKNSPSVSIGLSERPNYFKDIIRRAKESPAPTFQFKPLDLGPCRVKYRKTFNTHKEPDLSPGPGTYLTGPTKAATDAIPPPGKFIKGAVFDRSPRFKDRIRLHDSEEERQRKRLLHDYVNENISNVETNVKKIEKITKFSKTVNSRVEQAAKFRAEQEKAQYRKSVELASKHIVSMNRRRICFGLRAIILASRQSYLIKQLIFKRNEILNAKIERAKKYHQMKIFQTWWRAARESRRNRMAITITCAIRAYIFNKRLRNKIHGANVIRRTLHAEQGMDKALYNIRKFRVSVVRIQRFLKKCEVANSGRIEILFRQGFRKVVTMLMELEEKYTDKNTTKNDTKKVASKTKKKMSKKNTNDKKGLKRHNTTVDFTEDIKNVEVKDEMTRIIKRQAILETLKPELYDVCRNYQKVIWQKYKKRFLKTYKQYENLKMKFHMVDPNNLSLRREINWELENFIFPRFSWLSPDEIVKQVAVETMASLHQVEKQWEADEKKK